MQISSGQSQLEGIFLFFFFPSIFEYFSQICFEIFPVFEWGHLLQSPQVGRDSAGVNERYNRRRNYLCRSRTHDAPSVNESSPRAVPLARGKTRVEFKESSRAVGLIIWQTLASAERAALDRFLGQNCKPSRNNFTVQRENSILHKTKKHTHIF